MADLSPKIPDFASLSVDDLMELYERAGAVLADKLEDEKRKLEKRLAQLRRSSGSERGREPDRSPAARLKRHYPPVLPKFRNPVDPTQTWAGRGKQPRWLTSQIKAGKKMDDFLIDRQKRKAKRPS